MDAILLCVKYAVIKIFVIAETLKYLKKTFIYMKKSIENMRNHMYLEREWSYFVKNLHIGRGNCYNAVRGNALKKMYSDMRAPVLPERLHGYFRFYRGRRAV